MPNPFLALFGLYAVYKLLDCGQKTLKCCSDSLQNISHELDQQQHVIPYTGMNDLKIDLKFDDDETLKDVQVEGGTVTKVEKDGDNTVIHITWKM